MLRVCLLSLVALLSTAPLAALAQAGDGGEDAGVDGGELDVPDGSVGVGGADRDGEEQEDSTGRAASKCATQSDCSPGFTCVERRCRYVGPTDAEGSGCLLGAQGALFLGGVALMLRRGRPRA